MLKFHGALSSGLAALAVVPILATQEDGLSELQQALAQTTHALAVLETIQDRIDDNPEITGLILASTEAPTLAERESDEQLAQLRNEVNLLAMELDHLRAPATTPRPARPTGAAQADGAPDTGLSTPTNARPESFDTGGTGLTTGLSPELRSSLRPSSKDADVPLARDTRGRQVAPSRGAETAGPAASERMDTSFEQPGYSADPIAQARASFRARRYAEGIALLEREESTEALYWRARCLEKLSRTEEASALLERLLTLTQDPAETKRAKSDLEFLRWKSDFLGNLPEGMREEKP